MTREDTKNNQKLNPFSSEKNVGNTIFRLVKDDITKRHVHAIVNAANSYLKHGDGVAAAILKNGGAIIQKESDRIGFVPVGSAVITSAGKLPCKAVIHAVGPQMGEGYEDNKLKSVVRRSLELAVKNQFESISIPAISSGIFGFPKDRCAKILVGESKEFVELNKNLLKLIEFCIFDDETLVHFQKEFEKL